MKMSNVTVLIPAYNEGKSIGKVIDHLSERYNCNIIVGNNCSTDDTADVCVCRHIASLIKVTQKGKGNVMRELFKHVHTDYAVMVDGDFTYPVEYYLPYMRYALENKADVVICNRKVIEPGAMTTINKFGNWALSTMASALYGQKVHDVCSGLWGWRRDAIYGFKPKSKGFTLEAELFAHAVKSNHKIAQIPIHYRKRKGDTAKLKVSHGVKIGWQLIKEKIV